MKNLSSILLEKLRINKDTKINKYNYFPKNASELVSLLEKLLKERGKDADLNDIDVSNVTDMREMFLHTDFNQNISSWNVSNVKYMTDMFRDSDFNQDISSWNVCSIISMKSMFFKSPLQKNPPKWYKK